MADAFDAQFITISAVPGGVGDIREAVERRNCVSPGGAPGVCGRGAPLPNKAGRVLR